MLEIKHEAARRGARGSLPRSYPLPGDDAEQPASEHRRLTPNEQLRNPDLEPGGRNFSPNLPPFAPPQ